MDARVFRIFARARGMELCFPEVAFPLPLYAYQHWNRARIEKSKMTIGFFYALGATIFAMLAAMVMASIADDL